MSVPGLGCVETAVDGLVLLARGANGLANRFCRCFAVSAFFMAAFAGYGWLDAANGSNNGRIQAGMACARI